MISYSYSAGGNSLRFKMTGELSGAEKKMVMELWNAAYPVTLQYQRVEQLEAYLDKLENTRHYMLYDHQQVIGWMPVFRRDGDCWFALLIDEAFQGKGLGTQLLNRARQRENVLNGWVVDREGLMKTNGEPYHAPLSFYTRLGFEVLPWERLETSQLSSVKIRWVKE